MVPYGLVWSRMVRKNRSEQAGADLCQAQGKGPVAFGQSGDELLNLILFHGDLKQLEPKTSGPRYTCNLSVHQVSATLLNLTC